MNQNDNIAETSVESMKHSRILPKNAHCMPAKAKKVFSGIIFDIFQWQEQLYDGTYKTFEMAKRADTVQIIGITNDGNVITINEQQPDGLVRTCSLPGGRVDPEDINVVSAAKREMQEETGYAFTNWKLLRVHQPQFRIERFIYMYVCWQVVDATKPKPDSGEKIEVVHTSWQDFLQNAPKKIVTENNLNKYKNTQDLIASPENPSD